MTIHINRRWLLSIFCFCAIIGQNDAIKRTFFIDIKEENWDYAPGGYNRISGKSAADDPHASVFLLQGPHRIGHVYKKAIYKQYTDGTYTTEIPKPAWLGYLGPVLKAEANDTIELHLKNSASRRYSVHSHGVFYLKNSEGALYPDGSSGADKYDDAVPPGRTHIYTWIVKDGPTQDDANCLTWAYHSHVVANKDISAGLIGALLTCKNGTLKATGGNYSDVRRTDVDKDFLLMFSVVDENLSWYLDENIHTFCSDPDAVDPSDEEFQQSNQMNAINGYVYGNLPEIELCQNQTVAWHLLGMGNEVDVHSVYFHGHTLLIGGHRVDTVSLFPATFLSVEMVPLTTGKWLFGCQVNSHLQDGMQALLRVTPCAGQNDSLTTLNGTTRKYYIAAEILQWNYAPSGIDQLNNVFLNDSQRPSYLYFGKDFGHLGGEYLKVVFRAYSDGTFLHKKEPTTTDSHLGILGPVLRAEVGDVLEVTFFNNADKNYSIQSHGLQYMKLSEGAQYEDGTVRNGSNVPPGHTFTYRWQVVEGPTKNDPPCITYLYFSSTDPVRDTNSGLVGPLLVCKEGALSSNDTQRDVDNEFFLLFSVFDENLSWYLNNNTEIHGTNESNPNDDALVESNMMHAVNGYMYGNLEGLDMCAGARVRWHILGLGTNIDMHGVHFQGNTFIKEGTTRDTLSVFPHTSATVFMQPDTAGLFEVSCRVSEHYTGGMKVQYRVGTCGQNSTAPPTVPNVYYFIAAEEVEWDYSPNRTWEFENFNATDRDSPGSIFVGRGENRLGSKYKKVIYREYTNDTFTTEKQRRSEEQHLEILGPIIRAEVGDVLQITFLNKASRPYSIQPHGLQAFPPQAEPVLPGNTIKYLWRVPERSGPTASQPNCITFAYYSNVDFIKDTVSGLIGPLVVCKKGTLDQNRQRTDVHREFALLFLIFDENMSWYLEDNIKTYYNSSLPLIRNSDFDESNRMHGINGKLYGNLHGLEMQSGEQMDWYLLGMGSEVDLHTVHLHGHTFIYKMDLAHRKDEFDLFPGTFQTIKMVARAEGTWLLHCHVADHISAGMEAVYTVHPRAGGSAVVQNLGIAWISAFISTLGLM
ncbi:ferroxidase HEPHL1 [Brachyhypopomus gauderio]|uniref:ferroxidase HEPHL1 n=1 Tax=Brachyhypopomus gauderio TaxID=698409 RepID=UPI004041A3C7